MKDSLFSKWRYRETWEQGIWEPQGHCSKKRKEMKPEEDWVTKYP